MVGEPLEEKTEVDGVVDNINTGTVHVNTVITTMLNTMPVTDVTTPVLDAGPPPIVITTVAIT